MEPRTTVSRVLRFRLRSLLVVIAFLGLLLTVIMQAVRLERAATREARLREELLRERARAEANLEKARAALDQFLTRVAEESAAAGAPGAGPRRESLEQALKFYQGMETRASSPEERSRAVERAKQIRSKLGDEVDEGRS
jgi:hypothetical protein